MEASSGEALGNETPTNGVELRELPQSIQVGSAHLRAVEGDDADDEHRPFLTRTTQGSDDTTNPAPKQHVPPVPYSPITLSPAQPPRRVVSPIAEGPTRRATIDITDELLRTSALVRMVRADSVVQSVFTEGKIAVKEQIEKDEEYLRTRPDALYQVIKINNMGRRQSRILALRHNTIENIKQGNKVTKSFSYFDVVSVWLDTNILLRIRYTTDHDFIYETPMAPFVVEELQTRLDVMRALRKRKSSYNVAVQFQRRLAMEGLQKQHPPAPLSTTTSEYGSSRKSIHSDALIAFTSRRSILDDGTGPITTRPASDSIVDASLPLQHFPAAVRMYQHRLSPAVQALLRGSNSGLGGPRLPRSWSLLEPDDDMFGGISSRGSMSFGTSTVPVPQPSISGSINGDGRVGSRRFGGPRVPTATTVTTTSTTATDPSRSPSRTRTRGRSLSMDRITPALRSVRMSSTTVDDGGMPSLQLPETLPVSEEPVSTQSSPLQGTEEDKTDGDGDDENSGVGRTTSRKALKLMSLTGSTEVNRVRAYVQQILHDPTQDEGRIRMRFLKEDFPTQLLAAGINPKSVGFKKPSSGYVPTTESPTQIYMKFMDDLFVHIMSERRPALDALRVELPLFVPDDVPNFVETGIVVESVSTIVLQAIELSLYPHVRAGIELFVDNSMGVGDAERNDLRKKITALQSKTQGFFLIPDEKASSDQWSTAVVELQEIDKEPMPSLKLRCLLSTVRTIYNTYVIEAKQRLKHEGKSIDTYGIPMIGADDFFPMFTYVFVHAQLADPWHIRNLIPSTCHPAFLAGEALCYWTSFEAAVEHIKSMELTPGGDVTRISLMF